MSPEDVLKLAQENEVEFVDLRFMQWRSADPNIGWQHRTIPRRELTATVFERGLPVADARAHGQPDTKGTQVVLPDPRTATLDPFAQHPTLALICDMRPADSADDDPYDPRSVARRAQAYLQSSGVADQARIAPTLQFFIFDQVCYEQGVNFARYQVESREGTWRRGRDEPDNLGTQIRADAGEETLPPFDSLFNLRAEIVAVLEASDIRVREHRHGPATGGQAVIELRDAGLLEISDAVMTAKYVARNVAARHGKVVTFMPQPLAGQPGSGLPATLTFWKDQHPLALRTDAGELSDVGRRALSGLLRHGPSLTALTCPSTNSFKRLCTADARQDPTAGGPSTAVWPPCVRSGPEPHAVLELSTIDSACNPYLAFSAVLMAVMDGIQRQIEPASTPGGAHQAPRPEPPLPTSLDEALRALHNDHAYLLTDDVICADFIDDWIAGKQRESRELQRLPHPFEFCQCFGC